MLVSGMKWFSSLYFQFISVIGYYKILNVVPCAVQ